MCEVSIVAMLALFLAILSVPVGLKGEQVPEAVAELPDRAKVAGRPLIVDPDLTHIVWFSELPDDTLRKKRLIGDLRPIPKLIASKGHRPCDIMLPGWDVYDSQDKYLRMVAIPQNLVLNSGHVVYSVMGSVFIVGDNGAATVRWELEHEVLTYGEYERILSISYMKGRYMAITFEVSDEVQLRERAEKKWRGRSGNNTMMWVGDMKIPKTDDLSVIPTIGDLANWRYLGQCTLSRASWFGDGILVTSGGYNRDKKLFQKRGDENMYLSCVGVDGKVVKSIGVELQEKEEIVSASNDLYYIAIYVSGRIRILDVKRGHRVLLNGIERVLGISDDGEVIGVKRKSKDRTDVVLIDLDGEVRRRITNGGGDTATCLRNGTVVYLEGGRIMSVPSGITFCRKRAE